MRRLREILSRVHYKDWTFHLGWINEPLRWKKDFFWLQVEFEAISTKTGVKQLQRGRRWLLYRDMTSSEVIQTALMAVLAAEEHEAREAFKYRGHVVFGPHLDVDAMVENAAESGDDAEDEATDHRMEARLNAIEALDPWRDLI